jgi:hypothetical protein
MKNEPRPSTRLENMSGIRPFYSIHNLVGITVPILKLD